MVLGIRAQAPRVLWGPRCPVVLALWAQAPRGAVGTQVPCGPGDEIVIEASRRSAEKSSILAWLCSSRTLPDPETRPKNNWRKYFPS